METERITLIEFCSAANIEEEFVLLLIGEELIDSEQEAGVSFLKTDQLAQIEQYARWYYDLEINLGGIDALRHLLSRVQRLQSKVQELETKLGFYEAR